MARGALDLMTASRARCARSCQRQHRYQYWDGYRPVRVDENLTFGTLTHLWLEAWWSVGGGDRLEAALSSIPTDVDPFDRARAEVMARGYDARWGDVECEVVGVEVEFRGPLQNPDTGAPSRTWKVGGKIDAIARLPDGRVMVVEHKTSSEDVSAGSDYWKRLQIDGQISFYYDGARALGLKVDGCIYDVLAKPALRPLKATPPESRKYTKDGRLYANQRDRDETPEEYRDRLVEAVSANPNAYYARGEVVRLESELEEARYDTWALSKSLQEAHRAGRYPRNPDACVRYGHTCPFFGVCTGCESLDNPELFRRNASVHPELSEAA